MKKILILIVMAIGLLSVPYFVGSTAEAHIDKMLANFNQNPNFKVTKVSYSKGWLSSTASYELELVVMGDQQTGGPQIPNMPKFKMSQTLFHGPILWKHDGLALGLMDSVETIELPEDWQQVEEALALSSRISFDGSIDASATLDSVDINEQGLSVNIMPAIGRFGLSNQGHITASFDWEGLKAEEQNKGGLELSAFHFKTDQQIVKGEMFSPTAIYSGNFSSTVDNISIMSEIPGASATLSKLALIADSEVQEELLNINFTFNIAEINAANQRLTNVVSDLSMLNLDIETMQEFNKLMMDYQTAMQLNPEASMEKLAESLQSIVPKLLAKNPVLKINNLGFTVDEGDVVSELTMSIDKDKFQAENMDTLISAIKMDSTGSAPNDLFVKYGLGPTIDAFVEQQLLTRKDAKVGYEFKMLNGETIVNGNPIPLF
ncbi:MAG: hypothetical protein ACI9IA_001050 [Enterobacterales bacterium]|jgi:uncharacterized protein YdgA (DUF945 family)